MWIILTKLTQAFDYMGEITTSVMQPRPQQKPAMWLSQRKQKRKRKNACGQEDDTNDQKSALKERLEDLQLPTLWKRGKGKT